MAKSKTTVRKQILYWLTLAIMFAAFVFTIAQPAMA